MPKKIRMKRVRNNLCMKKSLLRREIKKVLEQNFFCRPISFDIVVIRYIYVCTFSRKYTERDTKEACRIHRIKSTVKYSHKNSITNDIPQGLLLHCLFCRPQQSGNRRVCHSCVKHTTRRYLMISVRFWYVLKF